MLKDNLQNTISRKVVKQLESNLNKIETKFRELYKQKKKFSWNWFTGNKTNKDQTPPNKLSELETLHLSLIEHYFLIGSYDLVSSELKLLYETLSKRSCHYSFVILEFSFYVSFLNNYSANNSPKKLLTETDMIWNKINTFINFFYFDYVKCLRLITLLHVLDSFAIINSSNSSKRYLMRATDFYEKFMKKQKDRNWKFDFIKPFYKEIFCYRNLITSPVSLRKFWNNLLLTSDYYPKKIQLGGEELQFKMFLGIFVFKFYRQIGKEWDLIRKFFSNFLSSYFYKFGKLESALYFYGIKLNSLQFESLNRKEMLQSFEDLQNKFLKSLFPEEHHFLLGKSFIYMCVYVFVNFVQILLNHSKYSMMCPSHLLVFQN